MMSFKYSHNARPWSHVSAGGAKYECDAATSDTASQAHHPLNQSVYIKMPWTNVFLSGCHTSWVVWEECDPGLSPEDDQVLAHRGQMYTQLPPGQLAPGRPRLRLRHGSGRVLKILFRLNQCPGWRSQAPRQQLTATPGTGAGTHF